MLRTQSLTLTTVPGTHSRAWHVVDAQRVFCGICTYPPSVRICTDNKNWGNGEEITVLF